MNVVVVVVVVVIVVIAVETERGEKERVRRSGGNDSRDDEMEKREREQRGQIFIFTVEPPLSKSKGRTRCSDDSLVDPHCSRLAQRHAVDLWRGV